MADIDESGVVEIPAPNEDNHSGNHVNNAAVEAELSNPVLESQHNSDVAAAALAQAESPAVPEVAVKKSKIAIPVAADAAKGTKIPTPAKAKAPLTARNTSSAAKKSSEEKEEKKQPQTARLAVNKSASTATIRKPAAKASDRRVLLVAANKITEKFSNLAVKAAVPKTERAEAKAPYILIAVPEIAFGEDLKAEITSFASSLKLTELDLKLVHFHSLAADRSLYEIVDDKGLQVFEEKKISIPAKATARVTAASRSATEKKTNSQAAAAAAPTDSTPKLREAAKTINDKYKAQNVHALVAANKQKEAKTKNHLKIEIRGGGSTEQAQKLIDEVKQFVATLNLSTEDVEQAAIALTGSSISAAASVRKPAVTKSAASPVSRTAKSSSAEEKAGTQGKISELQKYFAESAEAKYTIEASIAVDDKAVFGKTKQSIINLHVPFTGEKSQAEPIIQSVSTKAKELGLSNFVISVGSEKPTNSTAAKKAAVPAAKSTRTSAANISAPAGATVRKPAETEEKKSGAALARLNAIKAKPAVAKTAAQATSSTARPSTATKKPVEEAKSTTPAAVKKSTAVINKPAAAKPTASTEKKVAEPKTGPALAKLKPIKATKAAAPAAAAPAAAAPAAASSSPATLPQTDQNETAAAEEQAAINKLKEEAAAQAEQKATAEAIKEAAPGGPVHEAPHKSAVIPAVEVKAEEVMPQAIPTEATAAASAALTAIAHNPKASVDLNSIFGAPANFNDNAVTGTEAAPVKATTDLFDLTSFQQVEASNSTSNAAAAAPATASEAVVHHTTTPSTDLQSFFGTPATSNASHSQKSSINLIDNNIEQTNSADTAAPIKSESTVSADAAESGDLIDFFGGRSATIQTQHSATVDLFTDANHAQEKAEQLKAENTQAGEQEVEAQEQRTANESLNTSDELTF
jgi:hypothetical protein